MLDIEGEEAPLPDSEYRKNNVVLMKQSQEQSAKLTALEAQLAKLLEGAAPKTEKAAITLEDKVEQLTRVIAEERSKSAQAETKARFSAFENQISTAAQKAGVSPKAVAAVLRASRETFREKEGQIVPLDREGKVKYSKVTGTDPLSVDEWLGELKAEEPFYFSTPQGGGARGSGVGLQVGAKVIDRRTAGSYIDDIADGKVALTPVDNGAA